ncbi:serine/threonine-protein kinase [Pseudonocardia endophytica]|uniref:non-specific serine/threonine protein kinase n=1 Tax=Pseudonocardia endophytica TaxID=401976 RepID=A0A4R1HJQ8_PSEEN|nr:serine/threonine-protein kinase [Pseudonocardia endophytica]TCK20735.1 serine/threonine protein kinase [Pseudonocardia endophytica]
MGDAPGDLTEDLFVAGRYRVHERIGAGGMGVVFRATDTRLKRQVALKRVLLRDVDDDRAAEIRHRTLREAEIAARVHHPRIVSIFDVLDDAGGPLLVLEYLPSQSMGELVADGGVLTPGAAARAGAQVAEALAAAHAAGIVHRDVKPGNVLAGPGDPLGPVKLADFGISHVPETSTLTSEGIGTPAYFAPEIARGDRPTPASDVYALGATLCAVAQGSPPYGWGTGNPLELIRRIGQDPVPAPTVGGPLGDVIARLTAQDPADRPTAASAAESLWQLADRYEPLHPVASAPAPTGGAAPTDGAAAGGAAAIGAEPTTGPEAGRRPWYRRPVVLAGAGVVVAAAVAGGVLVATGGPSGDAPAFPSTVQALSLGDDRTADPCAPVRPDALQSFGKTTEVPDYGNFASCEISIAQRGSDTIDVSSRYRPSSTTPPEGDQQRLGDALIVRRPADGPSCQRYVVLADGTPLEITAEFQPAASGSQGPLADVCTVAEAAAASAATTFADDGIVRRTPPASGLWTKDACTLLTADDLRFLPAEDRSDGFRNNGGWQCEWGDGKDPETSVMISFDRYDPPQQTGDPAPGTPAFIDRDEQQGVCNAEVPKQPFLAVDGEPRTEVLRVKTEGPLGREELCDRAAALANAANART